MSEKPKTNKIKVTIEMTYIQRKDFFKALDDIINEGAKDQGRACQLLAANYQSGKEPIKKVSFF